MKLEIKQSILMEHLNYVIKGISSKNIIPVLNCIKFELSNEGLYLLSTDNDIAIKSFIPKEQIEKIEMLGTILVSGRYIYEIIKKLPGEIIKIEEVLDNKIDIKTSNSNFNLNCNDSSEFPIIDLQDSENPIIVNKSIFKNIIRQTAFASSGQESRPALTGINFKINGNILEASATDSYRVSQKKVELKEESKENINIIIPTRNLNELIKLINDEEGEMELHIFANKIIFKFNNIIMMSRLINGEFPDLSKLIPNDYYLELTVKLDSFYSALDRASLFTNESDKNIVTFITNENYVQISSNIPEIGHVEETIDIEKNNENEIEISFSSKYMMDAIRALECESIKIMFSGELKPIIIKNLDNDNLIELIVPIRTC
jgi:DNA polymerase-3 subunit beta